MNNTFTGSEVKEEVGSKPPTSKIIIVKFYERELMEFSIFVADRVYLNGDICTFPLAFGTPKEIWSPGLYVVCSSFRNVDEQTVNNFGHFNRSSLCQMFVVKSS